MKYIGNIGSVRILLSIVCVAVILRQQCFKMINLMSIQVRSSSFLRHKSKINLALFYNNNIISQDRHCLREYTG